MNGLLAVLGGGLKVVEKTGGMNSSISSTYSGSSSLNTGNKVVDSMGGRLVMGLSNGGCGVAGVVAKGGGAKVVVGNRGRDKAPGSSFCGTTFLLLLLLIKMLDLTRGGEPGRLNGKLGN